MSSSRFASVTIAGVDLVDSGGVSCRGDVLDGEALRSVVASSNVVALDGTVHTQWQDRGLSGVPFGVRVAQMPVAKLNAVVAAIEAAIRAGSDFTVQASDDSGVDLINVKARLEMPNGKHFTRGGNFSSGLVREVTFRFLSSGDNES